MSTRLRDKCRRELPAASFLTEHNFEGEIVYNGGNIDKFPWIFRNRFLQFF